LTKGGAIPIAGKGSLIVDLTAATPADLLRLHAGIADELRRRDLVRSSNNPAGDYAEYLFCRAFGWTQAEKSARAADARCAAGKLYQIKSRRPTIRNPSRQLSAMRGLDAGGFDYLAGILFNEDYSVKRAAIVPHTLVLANATFVEYTKSWKFYLRDAVWTWPQVEDVTDNLRAAESA